MKKTILEINAEKTLLTTMRDTRPALAPEIDAALDSQYRTTVASMVRRLATTGDGLMAALQALGAMLKSGKPASETFNAFQPVPQLLKNVRIRGDAKAVLADAAVQKVIADAESQLGGTGRILVRKSGTEALIRVMAEGDDSDLVHSAVDRIVEALPQ